MKKRILIAALLATGVFFGATGAFAADPASSLAGKQVLEGVVTPMLTTDMQFQTKGLEKSFVTYVMPAGTFFKGSVYDESGNVLEPGDILAKIDSPLYAEKYRQAKADWVQAKDAYERLLKIGNQKVSKETMFDAKIALMKAELAVKGCQLYNDKFLTTRAMFDGYVNEVTHMGLALPAKAINISQINPIYISIPKEQVKNFNYNTPVTIYPMRKGGQPAGYIQGRTTYNDNQVMLIVVNQPLPPPVSTIDKDGKQIPILRKWCPVFPHPEVDKYIYTPNQMIVSKEAIFGEPGHYYVWMVEGAKSGEPGVGMDYINTVKKVEVNTDTKILEIPSFVDMIAFTPKEDGAIACCGGAVLLSKEACPSDLKNGDKVCLYAGMYTFMPGDKVKVEIGPTPEITK